MFSSHFINRFSTFIILFLFILLIYACSKEVHYDEIKIVNDIAYLNETLEPFTGTVVEYKNTTTNGILRRTEYLDGRLNGTDEKYFENSDQLRYRKNYKDGKLVGKFELWDADGNLSMNVNWVSGKEIIEGRWGEEKTLFTLNLLNSMDYIYKLLKKDVSYVESNLFKNINYSNSPDSIKYQYNLLIIDSLNFAVQPGPLVVESCSIMLHMNNKNSTVEMVEVKVGKFFTDIKKYVSVFSKIITENGFVSDDVNISSDDNKDLVIFRNDIKDEVVIFSSDQFDIKFTIVPSSVYQTLDL
jgi:hypothetical protein